MIEKHFSILFSFICHTLNRNYKKYKKSRKKKWRGDLTETKGAYEKLSLLERARAVYIFSSVDDQLKKKCKQL